MRPERLLDRRLMPPPLSLVRARPISLGSSSSPGTSRLPRPCELAGRGESPPAQPPSTDARPALRLDEWRGGNSRPPVVAALFRDGLIAWSVVAVACRELRALSIAVIVSGPIECDLNALSYSVMGTDADRFDSPSFPLVSAEGSYRRTLACLHL